MKRMQSSPQKKYSRTISRYRLRKLAWQMDSEMARQFRQAPQGTMGTAISLEDIERARLWMQQHDER